MIQLNWKPSNYFSKNTILSYLETVLTRKLISHRKAWDISAFDKITSEFARNTRFGNILRFPRAADEPGYYL